MKQNYVGFGTSTNFLAGIDKSKPINAESITHAGKFGKYGICFVQEVIILSQVQESEVLYLRMVVGGFQSLDGRTEIGGERNRERARSAWELTKAWLTENGVTFREALVAMPASYKYMDGYAEYMHYSKKDDKWLADPKETNEA